MNGSSYKHSYDEELQSGSFPSPLEVTGGSNNMALTDTKILGAFPSPPEVTGVSNEFAAIVTTEGVVFPYPLEVNEGF